MAEELLDGCFKNVYVGSVDVSEGHETCSDAEFNERCDASDTHDVAGTSSRTCLADPAVNDTSDVLDSVGSVFCDNHSVCNPSPSSCSTCEHSGCKVSSAPAEA